MAQINVNTESLLRLANQLQDTSSDLNDDSKRLSNVKGNVEAAWKSKSTRVYTDEIEIVRRNINKISDEAEESARIIKKYVEEIKRIEKENSQMFKS